MPCIIMLKFKSFVFIDCQVHSQTRENWILKVSIVSSLLKLCCGSQDVQWFAGYLLISVYMRRVSRRVWELRHVSHVGQVPQQNKGVSS